MRNGRAGQRRGGTVEGASEKGGGVVTGAIDGLSGRTMSDRRCGGEGREEEERKQGKRVEVELMKLTTFCFAS
jgi:hypothetical protein